MNVEILTLGVVGMLALLGTQRGSRALQPVVDGIYVLLRDVPYNLRPGEFVAAMIKVRRLHDEKTGLLVYSPLHSATLEIHMDPDLWNKTVRPFPGSDAWRKLEIYDLRRNIRVWPARRSIRGIRV